MYIPKGKTNKTEDEDMNCKKMTYKQLEQKVAENRRILRTTKDLSLKRRIILEDHELMTEMDRRWNMAQIARARAAK